jgi:lysophospholipase L1-like esterase
MLKRTIAIGLLAPLVAALIFLAVLIHHDWQSPSTSGEYVALGSSFAAGVGLGPRQPGSPLVCMRSTQGYPQQLARMTGLSLVDMTCSGSTTEHILRGGQMFLGPQLAAVGANTRLVTITSGGNDVAYIGDLMFAAGRAGPLRKLLWKGPKPLDQRDFAKVGENFARIVAEVRRRAPAAKVVLVSCPTVLPPRGTCGALGLDPEMAERGRQVAARLDETTKTAAERSGALFVDMGAASIGHDACSSVPWINGAAPREGTPFHPNQAGARAAAEVVFKAISRRDQPGG